MRVELLFILIVLAPQGLTTTKTSDVQPTKTSHPSNAEQTLAPINEGISTCAVDICSICLEEGFPNGGPCKIDNEIHPCNQHQECNTEDYKCDHVFCKECSSDFKKSRSPLSCPVCRRRKGCQIQSSHVQQHLNQLDINANLGSRIESLTFQISRMRLRTQSDSQSSTIRDVNNYNENRAFELDRAVHLQHLIDITVLQRHELGNPRLSGSNSRINLNRYESRLRRLDEIHTNERHEMWRRRHDPPENRVRWLQNLLDHRPNFVEQIISDTNY